MSLTIKDLVVAKELSREECAAMRGGFATGNVLRTNTIGISDPLPSPEFSAKGKADPGDFHFFHHYDKASPILA